MAPLAHLLLVACAFAAPLHAASIPDSASEAHRKIPSVLPEEIKESLEKDHGHDLSDLHEPVKQIENELSVKLAEGIPVEVVVEGNEPPVKINEVKDEDEIKRPQVDLRNPGPPQRQEHETQNPEQHSDDLLKVSAIKERIEETQDLLKQSFQDVTQNIQNWFPGSDGQLKIQQNIQDLRETFSNQIQKLNDTIQALANPEGSKPADSEESQRDFKLIESRLKILEDNFNNGVLTLSSGVDIIANLKSTSDNENHGAIKDEGSEQPASSTTPASSTAPLPTAPLGMLVQLVGILYNGTRDSIRNVTHLILPQASTSQGEVQADESAGATGRPPWFQLPNITLPTFLNPQTVWTNFGQLVQNGQNGQNGPWNSIFGLFPNGFGGPTTAKPVSGSPAAGDKPLEPKPESESNKPAEAAASPPVSQPAASQPVGPIRQFLNNNPITQGIVGTVQRLQNSIANSETPRVPVEKSDSVKKGGWIGKPGNQGGSGDNNDSGLSEPKEDDAKEPISVECKKETDVEAVKPAVVTEKTEQVVV